MASDSEQDPIVGVDTIELDKLWQKTEDRVDEEQMTQAMVAKTAGMAANQLRRVIDGETNVKLSTLRRVVDALQKLGNHTPAPQAQHYATQPNKKAMPQAHAEKRRFASAAKDDETTVNDGLIQGGNQAAEASPPDREGPPPSEHPVQNPLFRNERIFWALVVCVLIVGLLWQNGKVDQTSTTSNQEEGSLATEIIELMKKHKEETDMLKTQLTSRLVAEDLPQESGFLGRYLAGFDSSIFYKVEDGGYEVARVLPNNAALYNETEFDRELDETVSSCDILANTAGVVRERWLPIIEHGLRRGVNYRIILSDYRVANTNLDAFQNAMGEKMPTLARTAIAEHHFQLQELIDRIAQDKKLGRDRQFHGTLQVKWNPKLLLYSMWIRDGRTPEALGHLGIHFYQGKNFWPCIRASKRTAPRMIENIMTEFEHAFDHSLEYDTLPFPPVMR